MIRDRLEAEEIDDFNRRIKKKILAKDIGECTVAKLT